MASSLRFFVSQVEVEVRCEQPEVLAALCAVWGSCATPLIATVQRAPFSIARAGAGFRIEGPDGWQRDTEEPDDVLPLFEIALYAAMQGWHRDFVVLHGACVASATSAFVLLGRSGAGKSSLARAAVRRGLDYFSDELTLTDGERVWGVPRAIQFEPQADGAQRPAWLSPVDLDSYRLRLHQGARGVVPLWVAPSERCAKAPRDSSSLRVIAIERADTTEVAVLAPIEALAVLHEAAFTPPRTSLGQLVRTGRAVQLRWADPEAAIEAMLALDAGPSRAG